MRTRIGAFVWTIFIVVSSLLPKGAINKTTNWINFDGLDKVVHFCFYMIFVFLWSKLLSRKVGRIKGARIAFYLSIVLGGILECLQYQLNSGRHFEVLDIIANIIGSIVGLTAFYKIIKL